MANKPKHTTTNNYDTGKLILVVLALLLAIAFVAISICQGTANFAKWNFSGTKQEQQQPGGEHGTGDSGLLAPDEHEANGISIKKMSIPVELYDDYGVSAAAETALQLTVTSSNGGELSDGKFSIIFDNPSSTWAKGKTLSQYVTLSQSDSTHATISCLKAFGEPIKVVYTYTGEDGDGTVKTMTAEYRLDYAKRIILTDSNMTNALQADDTSLSAGKTLLYNTLDMEASLRPTFGVKFLTNTVGIYSDYTVDDTFTMASTSTFKFTDSFKSACQSAGITLAGANEKGKVKADNYICWEPASSSNYLQFLFGDSVYKTASFRNVVTAQNANGIFEINITMQGTHSTWTGSMKIQLSINTFPVASQGVQIQDQFSGSSYIF